MSLYTWTKAIAAGVYLVAVLAALLGVVSWESQVVEWVAPAVGLFFLAVTGVVLIFDLEHPERFYYLFVRPQWRSWLVKGAVIILVYGAALSVHLLASILGSVGLAQAAAVVGVPAGVMTAVYTAYLFAQSKARDLWQSPLLPFHMAWQAAMAGTAVVSLAAPAWAPEAADTLGVWLAVGAGLHLLLVWGEVTLAHPTAHARLAVRELTRGRYRAWLWGSVALVAVGLLGPVAAWAGVPLLAGLAVYEHGYVQAAQSVPLA